MYFVSHEEKESKENDTMSRKNPYEANFVVALCRYLILQGYQTSQVTILTTYSGQLYQIKSLMKKHEILRGVHATVVDNFQGEENDIIILSFVRSNNENDIGFLKVSNRVNVALSRAKKGLYCIGNFNCLLERSPLWQKIIQKLKLQKAIGSSLELYCQNHPETSTYVEKGEDFVQCPEGGCLQPCITRLICGHVCPSTCHVFDSEHELMKCHKPCDKIVCEREHRCKKKCHYGKVCGQCIVRVPKLRSTCGHVVKVRCSENPMDIFCNAPCDKIRSCGHKCQLLCGNNCEANPCHSPTETRGTCGHMVEVKCKDHTDENVIFKSCKSRCEAVLDCGHVCGGNCGSCYRGRLHVKCKAICRRPLICGHLCNDKCATNCPPCKEPCPNLCGHSKCTMKCGKPCAPCREPCQWVCEHKQCTKLCKENCDRNMCKEACKKLLKCGHQCIGICGEPCPALCRICNKETVEEIFFGAEDEPDARFILLIDCKHIIEVNGLLNWMSQETAEETREGNRNDMSIQMKACPKCKTIIRQTKAVNTFIQSCLRDLEGVKVQTFGTIDGNRKDQIALYETMYNYVKTSALPDSEYMTKLRLAHELFLSLTKPKEKGVGLSKSEICKFQNFFEIWMNIVEVLNNFSAARRGSHKNIAVSVISQLELRTSQLIDFIHSFNNNKQEMEDIRLEIRLLQMSADTVKGVNEHLFNEQGQNILRNAFETILRCGRFTDNIQENFKKMCNEANKLQSGIGVTVAEKEMILKVMAFSKGKIFVFVFGAGF